MEEENWCMQWSSEVLPELAMIPDRGVFLHATAAYSQVVATREGRQVPISYEDDIREVLSYMETQGRFPGRLKLPFTLSPFVRRDSPEQVCVATSNEGVLFRREREAYDGTTTCSRY